MPNIALGGNSGMESVVVLCNHLERMMKNKETTSSATIHNVFAAYQDERLDRMKQISNLSSFITRVQAWDSLWHRFLGTWVLPLQPDRVMADQMGEIMRVAPKLDFLSTRGFPSGRLLWKDEEAKMNQLEKGRGSSMLHRSLSYMLVRLLGATLACVVAWHGVLIAPALLLWLR
jgi:hypothetical protein